MYGCSSPQLPSPEPGEPGPVPPSFGCVPARFWPPSFDSWPPSGLPSCGWLVPATGLPMPFLSYGGSSSLSALLGVAICANISARREPVLAGDGFT